MFISLSSRQTAYYSRCLLFRTSLSTLPYPKSSETQARPDGTPINYPTAQRPSKEPSSENLHPIASNDLLDAKRNLVKPVVLDPKVSNILVLPGEPLKPPVSPLPTIEKEEEKKEEDQHHHHEHIPSSRFSAFLHSIRSGLSFFPKETRAMPVQLATTREHFLPLARPSLIRLLATDSQLIDDDENRLLFHELCKGLDSAVVQRYHPILNELKNLFKPLNPDHETIDSQRFSSRERLDNEYWLLQKIDDLLHRSNFRELPRDILLEKFIIQRDSSSSSHVNVKINGYDYDVLKFWILGREQIPLEDQSRIRKLFRKTNPLTSMDYFKRVILAVRLKGQDRLYLKAFRDIPLQNLPQLLPIGKLQIGQVEQRLIWSTFFVATSTAVAHLITTMANFQLPGLVVGGTSLSIILALWSFKSAYQSKINYLSNMNRILFYKNIASNKQLLAMIIDRAEDELSKEVLLTYVLILWRQKQNAELTAKLLELEVENWVRTKTNTNINFKSDQAIEFLRTLGVLLPEDSSRPGRLQVIPFKQVVGILPQISRSLSEKNEEWDLIEGYDKKYFELDWQTVLNEDKLLQKGGWY